MGKSDFMIDPYPDPAHPMPRPLLLGGAALAIATVALIAGARGSGVGVTQNKAAETVMSRDLAFTDAPDGSLDVRDVANGRTVARVPPDTGGFVRATLRGLDRNRLQHSNTEAAPFRVALDRDNHLWLQDLATGQSTDLRAFGPTNAAAFAAFLAPEPAS